MKLKLKKHGIDDESIEIWNETKTYLWAVVNEDAFIANPEISEYLRRGETITVNVTMGEVL